MQPSGASTKERHGEPGRIRSAAARLNTGARLMLAFGVLVLTLLVGVALQFAAVQGIERERAEAETLEERLLVAVQLESAVRRQLAHQPLAAAGDPVHLDAYRLARRDVAALSRVLAGSLRATPMAAWIAQIEEAADALDRSVEARAAGTASSPFLPPQPGADASALVFALDADLERLFATLESAIETHRDTVAREENAIHRLAIGLVLATALLAVGLTLYLSRSVARPLATLHAGAARIAGGQLDTRIDIRTPDEFGAVAAQLNQVAAHLQEHRERLSRAEALAAVGRCTAEVVHELNGSLQVMLGYLTLDRDRVAGEIARNFERMESEARRSAEIVNAVLELSRTPSPLGPTVVDLRAVADEVAGALRVVAADAGPEISVDGGALALGTPGRYHQIIANLARNAVDAAGPGGRVRIHVAASGSAAEVAVDDTGPGIAAGARDRLFEPFFTTKAGGTGLGLAISRGLAAALGGDIAVGASDLGGARFTLRVAQRRGDA